MLHAAYCPSIDFVVMLSRLAAAGLPLAKLVELTPRDAVDLLRLRQGLAPEEVGSFSLCPTSLLGMLATSACYISS